MLNPRIVIIGAGGFGKVVSEIIQHNHAYTCIGFIDSQLPVETPVINNLKVVLPQSSINEISNMADYFVVAIGNNLIRKNLIEEASKYLPSINVMHSSAQISPSVEMGNSNIIMANTFINTNCIIGSNCIIDSGAILDHEVKLGNHIHVGIGSIIGNNATIGDHAKILIGSVVQPYSLIS